MATDLSFAQMRDALNALAEHGEEYAGLPMPITGENLVVHPQYRFAQVFAQNDTPDGLEIINRWSCKTRRADIIITIDPETGRREAFVDPWPHPADFHVRTLGIASCAYEIGPEMKATEKLQSLLTPHAFKCYLLAGAFLETSRRSQVTYLFRRLRPTLAFSTHGEETTFLAALCLHPIGYYSDSWAGAMVPTDEVIAHLLLMRGDEPDFWRQANQHPKHRPEAGL